MNGRQRPAAAFYCVCEERFFPGAVALIDSLRLQGHTEPVFVLDCGLTARQRELLEPHVTLVPAPADTPPYLLKTVAPLAHPAEVRVLIDADMILTRPLTELIESAAQGRVVAFENNLDRFVPEWGELLDLGPVRRRRYLSSGLVMLGGGLGDEVLRLLDDRQARVEFDLTYARRNVATYPLLLLDQDVLNAILASRVPEERVVGLDLALAPSSPFPGVRLIDERILRCAYADGREPYVLHHIDPRKPWRGSEYRDLYSRLLPRLLLEDDVTVRVPDGELPRRMRSGLLGRAERARQRLGWYARDHVPESVLGRLDAYRRRRREREL
jgi:hypothetical protein